ncbi:hypothetical protein C7445_104212 [Alicyclobacillus sacchari]|uniref:Uncharacterized protein n=1 Tax=Alicyclobacillus sacchari TaxID=392010 RepID=A0A4R8LQ82_9BACL|nr:DUF188 domain-containing protein [Alicyclobacillus sacchari]TDY49699.1 hypothetical protein C7445_104212 [Alicyclobacillus sacchari]GMA58384.1 UPF0178 protein [Alicyclobacillus sacchari]
MNIAIWIDADATPRSAVAIARELARTYGAVVTTVSSINHLHDVPNHITVDADPQAADMAIVNHLDPGVPTVVITQDYGLAALALARGAAAVSPTGLAFDAQNIDMLLANRDIHMRMRRMPRSMRSRLRGPKARSAADDERFRESLANILKRWTSRHP